MTKPDHLDFEIEVQVQDGKRQFIKRRCGSEVEVNFTHPITSSCPKLYVIRSMEKPRKWHYIGQTCQSLQTRLRAGLNPPVTAPYGYQWAKNLGEESVFRLDVLVFQQSFESDEHAERFIEGVEAELVFQIRTETKTWPLFQNEIHFNNYNGKLNECSKVAQAIFLLLKGL